MTRIRLLIAAGLTGLVATLACSDILSPARGTRYDWRLLVPYDSAGPRVDSLSFHWPRSSLPVKIWVEDQYGVPDRIREGIALWKLAFLYGEWDAVLTNDSTVADVIVRTIQPPPIGIPVRAPLRLDGAFQSCFGATDVDTGATRFQLQEPMHTYVYPSLPNSPDITQCLRVVAAHELGHTLGIFQHSTDSLDLMFSAPTVDALSDRDVGTAVNDYHFPADMVPVKP
jgi:predicted Zn-dependent protease